MKTLSSPYLLLVLSTLLLCQCEDRSLTAKIKSLRDEVDSLNHDKYEVQQQVKRLQSQIDAAKSEKGKLEKERTDAEADRDAAKAQLDQLKKDFEAYKVRYKVSVREHANGMKLQDFASLDGREYKRVVLREVTDDGISFNHDGGIMRLASSQLPGDVQDILGYFIDSTPREITTTGPALSKQEQLREQRRQGGIKIQEAQQALEKARNVNTLAEQELKRLMDAKNAASALGQAADRFDKMIADQATRVAQLKGAVLAAEVDVTKAQTEAGFKY